MEECTNADTLVPVHQSTTALRALARRNNGGTSNTTIKSLILDHGFYGKSSAHCSCTLKSKPCTFHRLFGQLFERTWWETCNVSIKHGVRDICHRTVCCCDLQRFQFNDKKDELLGLKKVCPHRIQHRSNTIVTTDHRH